MDNVSIVFLIIGCLGLGLALISYFLGEIGDIFPGAFHFDDAFGGGHQFVFSNFFNIGTITGILAGFGFGGLIGYTVFNTSPIKSSIIGILTSIILAVLLNIIYNKFSKSIYTSSIQEKDLIGKNVTVTEDIVPDEMGYVSITLNDMSQRYLARGIRKDKKYVSGETVKIKSINSGILYIE